MSSVREVIACDVSYYQRRVDDSYPYRWFIFRCCDAGFHDPNCEHNRAWAARALADSRIDGWTAYTVYRPGRNDDVLMHCAELPPGGHVMVDVESWEGKITGNRSAEINQLVAGLRKRFPGQSLPGLDRVWAYGNRSDLASIYPDRGAIPVVVASYGGSKPDVPHTVGWQYTDGTWRVPGLPSSSPPFGACDHNVLYLPVRAAPVPTIPSELEHAPMFEIIRNSKTGATRAAGPNFWRELEGATEAETRDNISRARTSPLCVNGGAVRDVSDAGMAFLRRFYTGK